MSLRKADVEMKEVSSSVKSRVLHSDDTSFITLLLKWHPSLKTASSSLSPASPSLGSNGIELMSTGAQFHYSSPTSVGKVGLMMLLSVLIG